jgi:hypothetical protein
MAFNAQGKDKKRNRPEYVEQRKPRFIKMNGVEVASKISPRQLEYDSRGRDGKSIWKRDPYKLMHRLEKAYKIKAKHDEKWIAEGKCRATVRFDEFGIFACSQRSSMNKAKICVIEQVLEQYRLKLYTK